MFRTIAYDVYVYDGVFNALVERVVTLFIKHDISSVSIFGIGESERRGRGTAARINSARLI